MSGYIVVLIFGFLAGLVFGPSTERLEAARLEGYLDGINPKIVQSEPHD